MANYVDSALLAFQSRINKRFNEAELREQRHPILSVGLQNQDFLMINPESIKESSSRSVKGYQFKKMAADNGTTRTHDHSGAQSDAMEVTLNWSTFSEKMSILLTLGDDNVIKRPEILDNQIMQKQRILRERIGAYLVAQLHAGRTATSNATVRNATFSAINDAFEIASASKSSFLSFAASVMRQHKHYGRLDMIADSVLYPYLQNIKAQGTANSSNTAYQFLDFSNIWEDNSLGIDTATAYTSGVSIVMPENSFAFIPWIPKINRSGWGDYESYVGGYGTLPDATGLPLKYAVHGYANRVDGSASGGSTQDVKLELEISVDVAFQAADLSTTDESTIYEFAVGA